MTQMKKLNTTLEYKGYNKSEFKDSEISPKIIHNKTHDSFGLFYLSLLLILFVILKFLKF